MKFDIKMTKITLLKPYRQQETLRVLELTRDLHADPELNKNNIETEYEAKYSGLGEKIKRVVIGRGPRDDV